VGPRCDLLATTAWQLVAGGLVLVPFAYVVLVATAGAYVAWFSGLRHLDAATVGLVGLLNPVTGVLLGTTLAGDQLTVGQLAGLALVLAGVALGRPVRRRPAQKVAVAVS
jgi:probable blue pigment (indigoidine) exporter